jgi:gp16 family phage-associated protein
VEHTQPIAAASDGQLDTLASTAGGRAAKLKSKEEAAQWFTDRGITISEWALERRFNPSLVYQVLAGTRKAVRGSSFQIAVALGMKSVPRDQTETA